jgi:hypothetical protein
VKKIILALVVILISTNTLHAAKFKWTKLVSTIDHDTDFYVDKNSVRKVGKFHYFWMMSNYLILEEDDDPNIKSNITFNILNCETNEYKNVTHTSFTLNKARGEIDLDIIIPDVDMSYFEWDFFGEKTSFGIFFKKVCKMDM